MMQMRLSNVGRGCLLICPILILAFMALATHYFTSGDQDRSVKLRIAPLVRPDDASIADIGTATTPVSESEQPHPQLPEMQVVAILGGGLNPDGNVPPHTQLRLDKAFALYRELQDGVLFITLSGGTPHKPNPLDAQGFPVWEATAAARKLIEMGVPHAQVFEENFSLDTVGNAYFLRAIHMEPSGYRKLTVITNDRHMDRTRAIFEHVFSIPSSSSSPIPTAATTARAATTNNKIDMRDRYRLNFESVASGIANAEMLAARRAREQASQRTFETQTKFKFSSLREIHTWLFREHGAYSTKRLIPGAENSKTKISAEVLKSY